MVNSVMRIFVSLPFRSRTTMDIENEMNVMRLAVSRKYKDKWVNLIPTLFKSDPPEDCVNGSLWYLGKSLEKMSQADLVVFSKDYKGNRGCEIEHICAEQYGFPILELTEEDYGRHRI